MSLSWTQRKTRLASLLKSRGDEDADGIAIDRLMHGQRVIGKTSKTTDVDALRFQDQDLDTVGTLDYGQFGVIDVVVCRLDSKVYVRKSVDKRFALRSRDQCSPQFERDILLRAAKTDSPWAPHLLCAFQTPTHLNLVMNYAEGGNLWDVLESNPDGTVPESDLRWWVPQVVSAIHWCHTQGFAHRDVKPHNFVLTPTAHVLLIDFGSAAPLLPPRVDGSQLIPQRYCLVPCGTCDYISPEILKAHEEALVALEMEDDDNSFPIERKEADGYGAETDWWSLGAMLYEMVYGVAPFFAPDIKQTYTNIMNYERSLKFDRRIGVSNDYRNFLTRLLTTAERRLGRRNIMEITDHPLFDGVDWTTLPIQSPPPGLHLPQFSYIETRAAVVGSEAVPGCEESLSQGFAFSALFQSSAASSSRSFSVLRSTPAPLASSDDERTSSSFIGFSWGPTLDAFPSQEPSTPHSLEKAAMSLHPTSIHRTPLASTSSPLTPSSEPKFFTPTPFRHPFHTPNRPYASTPHGVLPRTSTLRRTVPRRNVSDREAMKQLVDCVSMSARKKVLESGRKPRILGINRPRSASVGGTGTLRKELRFFPTATPIPAPDYHSLTAYSENEESLPQPLKPSVPKPKLSRIIVEPEERATSASEGTDSEGPPSPSPRPGSAMSIISRRSGTPTWTGRMSGLCSNSSGTGFISNPSSAGLSATSYSSLGITRFRSGSLGSRLSCNNTELSHSRDASTVTHLSAAWKMLEDSLQERYAALLMDIEGLEKRLEKVVLVLEK